MCVSRSAVCSTMGRISKHERRCSLIQGALVPRPPVEIHILAHLKSGSAGTTSLCCKQPRWPSGHFQSPAPFACPCPSSLVSLGAETQRPGYGELHFLTLFV